MDVSLIAFSHAKRAPVMNKDVMYGLAWKDLKSAKDFVDISIRCGEGQYPEGLEYVGSERCTPMEELRVVTSARANQRSYELAHSTVRLIRYHFRFKGSDIYGYQYLPYALPGNLIYIKDKLFTAAPVMRDVAFSIQNNQDIFIRMLRAPVTFSLEDATFKVDGARKSGHVVHSLLHNAGGKKCKNRTQRVKLGYVHSTMTHYLFCKYGFQETFDKYTKAQPVLMFKSSYNPEDWPSEKYVVCTSSDLPPKGLKTWRGQGYTKNQLVAIVDREHFTPMVRDMILGLFYVTDHFADEIHDPLDLLDKALWVRFMGYILWGDLLNLGRLQEDMDNHLKSIDAYVDYECRKTLKEEQVFCEDIYDLMAYIIENMQRMLSEKAPHIASLYGKRLEILQYLLRDINNAMFEFLFKITSNSKKVHTKESIEGLIREHFKYTRIYSITGADHPEVTTVSSPSDNMFFKLTSVVIQQNDMHSRGRSKETTTIGPTMYLDASYAEVTSYNVLPKSNPVGNNRLNPCILLGPKHTIRRKEKFRALIDDVQRRVKRY